MPNTVSIRRGDTRTLTITITDANGAAFDLSGYTMYLTAKKDPTDDDADAIFKKTATIAVPASGVGSVALTSVDTAQDIGAYYYDVEITDGSNKYTPVYDRLNILEDVTKS